MVTGKRNTLRHYMIDRYHDGGRPGDPPHVLYVNSANDPRFKAYQDSSFLYKNNSYKGKIEKRDLLSNTKKEIFLNNWDKHQNEYDRNKLSFYINKPEYQHQRISLNDRMFKPVTLSFLDLNSYNGAIRENDKDKDYYIEDKGDYVREHSANHNYIVHKNISPVAWVDSPYYKKPITSVFVKGSDEYNNHIKQLELINAGYDIGPTGADGIWGDKSNAVWEKREEDNKLLQNKIEQTFVPVINNYTKPKKTTVWLDSRGNPTGLGGDAGYDYRLKSDTHRYDTNTKKWIPKKAMGGIVDDPLRYFRLQSYPDYITATNKMYNNHIQDRNDYDYESAIKAGMGPDETGHWSSMLPIDENTSMWLKRDNHPTRGMTIMGNELMNWGTYRGEDGRLYSYNRNPYRLNR